MLSDEAGMDKPALSFTACANHNSISRGNNRVRGSSKRCSYLNYSSYKNNFILTKEKNNIQEM